MAIDKAYNYPAFSWDFEARELSRWLAAGPRTGEMAPDFELMDLDGNAVTLRGLRGRPVVLEFGSYTCPIFSDRRSANGAARPRVRHHNLPGDRGAGGAPGRAASAARDGGRKAECGAKAGDGRGSVPPSPGR